MGRGPRRIADTWTSAAQRLGYPARSVFKLQELDERRGILKPGQRVIDLGSAPGSWLQYIAHKVLGSESLQQGAVLGIDLHSVRIVEALGPRCAVLHEDVRQWIPSARLLGNVDVVTSDLAPHACGVPSVDWARAFELQVHAVRLATTLLPWKRGVLVLKTFRAGDEFAHVTDLLNEHFDVVEWCKPAASRKESSEIFAIASRVKSPLGSEKVEILLS